MRGIAEFTMRGRLQALLVIGLSIFSVFFFWVGAAALALVVLRRGISEGSWLLLWALLPALLVLQQFNEFAPLAALLGAFAAAAVLRSTVSWPPALVVATAAGAMTGGALMLFAGAYLAEVEALMADFIGQLQGQMATEGQALELPVPDALFIAGSIALVNALTVVVSLILGRYWQALLYNPGGFREEFHQVRLPLALSATLIGIALAGVALGGGWLPWGFLATVPCLIAGISLVHGMVGLKQWKGHWLVLFYLLLVLVNPVKEMVIVAALVDSAMNLRQRIAAGNGRQ